MQLFATEPNKLANCNLGGQNELASVARCGRQRPAVCAVPHVLVPTVCLWSLRGEDFSLVPNINNHKKTESRKMSFSLKTGHTSGYISRLISSSHKPESFQSALRPLTLQAHQHSNSVSYRSGAQLQVQDIK